MKIKSLLIAGISAMPLAASASVLLHGPADYDVASITVATVDTILSSELNDTDDLVVIEFTANNTDVDGWITLTLNSGGAFGSFNSDAIGGFLTRVSTNPAVSPHDLYNAPTIVADSDAAANFTASDGLSHAVRITLRGFSGSGNNVFTGIHNALFEVDHFATVFSTADASMTADIDFGLSDVGMTLRLEAAGDMDVDNLTVTQVPEPGTYALIGGLLALGSVMVRRRQL